MASKKTETEPVTLEEIVAALLGTLGVEPHEVKGVDIRRNAVRVFGVDNSVRSTRLSADLWKEEAE